MIVVGAGGFAKQMIDIIDKLDSNLVFFDNTEGAPLKFLNKYPVIHTLKEAEEHLKADPFFCIAVGGPLNRQQLFEAFCSLGGKPKTIISHSTSISNYNVEIGKGSCVLGNVLIEPNVKIGKGCAININVGITHDCEIGDFCELGPAVTLCGNVKLGTNVFVGAGATILPKIKVGNNCIIGAGALVAKDVPSNLKVVGVPAR